MILENMAIALVVTNFDKGGLEQVVFNLYLGYKNKGVPTYILAENVREGDYFVSLIKDIDDFYVFNADQEQFWGFCYKHHITHLHYHYNIFQIDKAAMYGVKTIYTIHNTYNWFNDDTIQYYGRKLMHSNKIIAVSTLVRNYFIERSDVPSYWVEVIQNGIDVEELEKNYNEFTMTRKNLNLDENHITYGFIASFLPAKHQIGMIGVMERVIKQNPNIKLLLVGNIGEQQYFNTFNEMLSESSAKPNITLVPYFEHKYMGQFLRETVDVFILSTLQEGCSNAVLEAICCGKPLIVTDVGNAQDIQNCSETTIVDTAYPDILTLSLEERDAISYQKINTNTQALANAMLNVSQNLAQYKQSAEKYKSSISSFGYEEMVDRYLEVLEGS
jgi:Glycosyltransferase